MVEDEPVINQAVTDRLRGSGYEVTQAWDGHEALARFAATSPDLVLLDVMLPGLDGHEVCRRVQAKRPVPVLMLTARDDEADILVGLGAGADDYLTKPFRMRELVARVAALPRRVDRHLTPTEFALLLCLTASPGVVLTRESLYAEVWGWSGASGTRTVDSHVKALRANIGADRVRTVHGVGYALEPGPAS